MKKGFSMFSALCLAALLLATLLSGCFPGEDGETRADVETGDPSVNGDEMVEVTGGENPEERAVDPDGQDADAKPSVKENQPSRQLVLPQVCILLDHDRTIDTIWKNIIDPVVQYFDAEGQTVVSIVVSGDGLMQQNPHLGVDVIVSKNDGTDAAVYTGFLHYLVNGQIPPYEPAMMDEGGGSSLKPEKKPAAKDSIPAGLVLPQVYVCGCVQFDNRENYVLIQKHIVEPLIEDYADLGYTAVSILITGEGLNLRNPYLGVKVVSSQNRGTHEGMYRGFLHFLVDGKIPLYEIVRMNEPPYDG